jgi:HlyD family secretion protein
MDRDITVEVRRTNTRRIVATTLIAIAIGGIGIATAVEKFRPSLDRSDVQVSRVKRGTIEETLSATGTIVPLVEQVISSPVEARVTKIRLRAGDRVKSGDELLSLDTSSSQLEAARLGDRVAQKESERSQLALQLDESIATLRAQIEQKKLDGDIHRYNAQQKSTLRAAGLASEQEFLSAQTALKKNDIELRQAAEALQRAIRSRAARLAAASSDLDQARRERGEADRQLQLAMLRSERDGVVTWIAREEGATVRRGDVIARIADLSAFRVDATMPDLHASRLAPGLRVHVKFDDSSAIAGTIDSIDPRIEGGQVRFRVALDEPAHARLRNNMRIDLAVAVRARANTLLLRRAAAGRVAGDALFVVHGNEATRTPVRFGLTGDDALEILSGLSEGDEVIVSDMTDYAAVRTIRIK